MESDPPLLAQGLDHVKSYLLDTQLPRLLAAVGLDTGEVLRKAGLAEDLFTRPTPAASGADYLALMQAIGELAPSDDLAVSLATADGIEQFNPPIFAAFCARDGLRCIERLAQYKPLIGPVRYRLETMGPESTLYLEGEDAGSQLPAFVAEGEFAFILHVLCSATKQHIKPLRVESAHPVSSSLEKLTSAPVVVNGINAITFALSDLEIPFISHNEGMWSYFEPELSRRLSELDLDDTTSARVRAALVELLPAGESNIEDVARKLATSARTLQRRLSDEGTTFRKQLGHVRLLLAKQYLSSGDMSTDSIAFMLGYLEANSFVRAFTLWTGTTPAAYRAKSRRV